MSNSAGQAKLLELRECVETVNKDASKFFEKGNKAAGVRARKYLQQLKLIAQELRVLIQQCKSEAAETAGGGVAGGGAAGEVQQQQQQVHQVQQVQGGAQMGNQVLQ